MNCFETARAVLKVGKCRYVCVMTVFDTCIMQMHSCANSIVIVSVQKPKKIQCGVCANVRATFFVSFFGSRFV